MSTDRSEGQLRLLQRREAIVVLGAGIGAVWYASRATGVIGSAFAVRPASASSTCVLTPEQTEGPFYVAGEPFRVDITEDRGGVPLKIRFRVQHVTTCKRIQGATVEIWHADAGGTYSGINGARTTFLRGQQTTNAAGGARFTTIYPGWYPGRTAHIHVKVHVGGSVVHTGQLYFADAVTNAVYALQPYAARGQRHTTNASDGIYASGGAQSMLKLHEIGRKGYRARIALAVRT